MHTKVLVKQSFMRMESAKHQYSFSGKQGEGYWQIRGGEVKAISEMIFIFQKK